MCDCEVRWMPAFLREFSWTGARCATPVNLTGVDIASLTEDQLVCGEFHKDEC